MVCTVVRRLTSRLPKSQTSLELSQVRIELFPITDPAAIIQPQLYSLQIVAAEQLVISRKADCL